MIENIGFVVGYGIGAFVGLYLMYRYVLRPVGAAVVNAIRGA